MPPGAAKLAISGELEADLFLLPDDLLDFAVFHLLELGRADCAFLVLCARVFNRRSAQDAADMIGAKWWFCSLHVFLREWPAFFERVLVASSHNTAGAVP